MSLRRSLASFLLKMLKVCRSRPWLHRLLLANPSDGLPNWFFSLCSGSVPLCNSDVLARTDTGAIALVWRNDEIYGAGWHVPGRILRYQETFLDAAIKTCEIELGCSVGGSKSTFRESYECISDPGVLRGHFVTQVFEFLVGDLLASYPLDPEPNRVFQAGEIALFSAMPINMLNVHRRRYATYFR